MKLRFWSSVLIFVSAYSPLSIILAIQDFDFKSREFQHPLLVGSIFGISVISSLILWMSVRLLKSSGPPLSVEKVSNRSGELMNYSIPYLVSFFAMKLDDLNMVFAFAAFMVLMFFLTLKTHNIFVNPVLALIGYNLYDVEFRDSTSETNEAFFLVKGKRLKTGDTIRATEVSEGVLLITDVNPES